MSRTKQIDYQRVTFSFPARVVVKLREKIGQNNMSKYISALVDKDLQKRNPDTEAILKRIEEFRDKHPSKLKKSTLETLREIRYGKKYS